MYKLKKNGQSVLRAIIVKGIDQGSEGDIILLSLRLEPGTFWS